MECIICQDANSEPLQDNTSCTCKYKVHASCWIDYVHSKTIVTCLMCRKDRAEPKKNEIHEPTAPELPIEELPDEEIPIEETIVITIQEEPVIHENAVNQAPKETNKKTIPKIVKIGICVVILIFVLIIIWA